MNRHMPSLPLGLGRMLNQNRWLRLGITVGMVLVLGIAVLTMCHYLVANAAVHTAADRAAQTAATIGGNATTTERDAVVAAAQEALTGWSGLQTDASQVQVVCSSPCMRHSPMTVSVEAQGRTWIPLGPLGRLRVSAHATRTSTGDQLVQATDVSVALVIATPLPTSTPGPTRTPAPTATPNVIPTGLPEPTLTATAPPATAAPAAPAATAAPAAPRPAAPTSPPPSPPPLPTDVPLPADLSIRSSGTQFDAEQHMVIVTLLVSNDGGSPADGVVVQQILPDGITLVDSTMPATRTDRETTWDVGTLAPQETRLIIALLHPSDATIQSLTQHVGVTSWSSESRTDNNQTSATVTW